jgi:tetratricopeptide (TPR) repeat protein
MLVCALLVPAAGMAQQWLKLTSPHFELYTTAGDKDGRAALLRFEQVRAFFLSIGQTTAAGDRVRLIGFDSRKEFQPYRYGENIVSFSFSEGGRDYIALERLDENTYPSAVFHYMQILIRHSGQELPLWLRRGVADVYSTLKPVAGKIQVGALMEGYRQTLENNHMLDLATFTSVDYDSPEYTDKNKSRVFYAQCWALAHMLLLSDQYGPKYGQFVRSISTGMSPADAFQNVYGKPLARVQSELNGYLRGEWFKVVYFDTKLIKEIEPPQVQPATPVETGLVLVSLHREPEKRQAMLEKLAAAHPASWEVAEAIGYAAWRKNDQDEARRRFADAARLGSTNARMYYDYSGLLRQAGRGSADRTEQLAALLEKAVALQPEFPQARYALGIHYYNARDYEEAVEHLAKAGTVERRDAPQYFRLLADSYYRTGQNDKALEAAESARQYARSPEEAEEVGELIAYLSGSPPAREAMLSEAEERQEEDREDVDPASEPQAPLRSTANASSRPAERPRLSRRPSDTPMEDAGYSESPAGPQTESVSGTLLVLDCLGEPGAKLTIMTGRQQLPLLIADPTAVSITGVPGGKFDFVCGPQKPFSVSVEYEPIENEELGTLGNVRAIDFR